MTRSADMGLFLNTARARADGIVRALLADSHGPTMALLVLHIARAEIARVAKCRIPEAQWPALMKEVGRLETAFDREAAATEATNAHVLSLVTRPSSSSSGGGSDGAA